MVCPVCKQDALSVHTVCNFLGFEEGDTVSCSNPKCMYSKFYEYDSNREIPEEN